MDLNLYFRVLWRFKFVVAVGFVLAIFFAFASMVKVSFAHGSPSLAYRQQPTWQSATRLLVTQPGFPWGRTVLPSAPPVSTGTSTPSGAGFADPSRFSGLAVLYAQFINGDTIQREIRKVAPPGVLAAQAVPYQATNSVLPLLDVIGLAHTPGNAARISKTGADLLRSYIERQQTSAAIPENQRVLLQPVSTEATLVKGRKKTLPIIAFVLVMIATVGLAFVLENLRPRIRAVTPEVEARRTGVRQTA